VTDPITVIVGSDHTTFVQEIELRATGRTERGTVTLWFGIDGDQIIIGAIPIPKRRPFLWRKPWHHVEEFTAPWQLAPGQSIAASTPHVGQIVVTARGREGWGAPADSMHNPHTGEWQPSIPLPFYERRWFRGERMVCPHDVCGDHFGSEERYHDHYVAVHELGLPDPL